ncbi:2-dehydro-3-deoxygluconokinase [Actinokineospora globicatena]|nr:sugar kinase [Actinokineospora globicatena]MCP2306834.1 2-dehydro-3-deoxygluconokinase [Actinokineospora globicatena]GLW82275.1 sugar kinase [Actinokineospora globicatena]GLW89132.1 sugar kinase [Actinokineospora globicatena]
MRNAGVEVVCLGESMAVFVPAEPGPADRVTSWTRTVGGAESNVARTLAGFGVRAAWVSAVGADPFGRAVLAAVSAAGVDVTGVAVDPTRPTGLYIKESDAAGSPVRYYRRGSAASAMGPDALDRVDLAGARLVHVSGITAALSPTCLALLRAVMDLPRTTHRVSFDLNWRPALWADGDAGVLQELADRADIVLVGLDEAEVVWGATTPAEVRTVLPTPSTLVVKQGAVGATLLRHGLPEVFEPALRVEVVEPVGAGDAFAAGFLAATLRDEPPARALRAGHIRAATVLRTHHDVADPLPAPAVDDLLDADPATWAATSWTSAGIGVRAR